MNSEFKNAFRLFKALFSEKEVVYKPEIFRRIYKLPKKPMTEKQYNDAQIIIQNEGSQFFQKYEIESLEENWSKGLDFFGDEMFRKLIDSIEIIFVHENPTFDFSTAEKLKNKQITEKEIDKNKLNSEEQKKLNDAKIELEAINSNITTQADVDLKYEKDLKEVEESYGARRSFCDTVFDGNAGRFSAYLKSKDKFHFLTPKERRKFNLLMNIIWENDPTGERPSEQEYVDKMEQDYPQSLYQKRKRNLKEKYRQDSNNMKETEKRRKELISIIEKLEQKK